MEVDSDKTYEIMRMSMTIKMMMTMIIAVTQSIFKLGPPDFAWKKI